MLVLQASILFKHEAYASEEEYRLLQLYSTGSVPGVKFKDKPYRLARYVEFDWRTTAAGSLRNIMIGPAAEADSSERYVNDCLRAFHSDSSQVEIVKSRIPY